ncbi:hypothetical protein [Profundibacter sp.]
MTLKSEIEALRAEIRDQARGAPTAATDATAEPATESGTKPSADEAPAKPRDLSEDIDAFLKTLNETLDEFAEELDRYPRLTALAALGIGLAAGVVIGRTSR